MSKKVKFTKMHGLGNNFIFINSEDLGGLNYANEEFIKTIADKNVGIGCDQFIIYHYNSDDLVDMYIYNSDGSTAKACGNASRCLGYLNFLKKNKKKLSLGISGREILCIIEEDGQVSVNMGEVSFDKPWMPPVHEIEKLLSPYDFSGSEIICADIGNPHLVIISNNFSEHDMELLGSKLEKAELFKDGVNVNFAKIIDNKIFLKVWERGVGFTLACGSGACSSFASAKYLGFVQNNSEVIFELGKLIMKSEGKNIIMTGSVSLICEGEYFYD